MPKRSLSQRQRRLDKTILTSPKLLRYFLLVAALVLIIGGFLRLVSVWNVRLWLGNERFTVVLTGDSPVIFSYQEETGLATIPLPKNLELEGSYNVGRWKVGSLHEVGKIQGIGDRLVTSTLQNTFGFPIDGWVHDNIDASKVPGFAGTLPSIIFSTDSNLTLFDKVRLATVISTTPQEARRVVSLERMGMVQKGPGETLIPVVGDLPRELVDTKVTTDGIGVGIVNKTKKGGLGRRASSVVEGMGAPVLWIRTEDPADGVCIVRGSKKTLDSLTSRKIIRLFSCKTQKEESLGSSIELILQKDIAQEFP